MADNRGILNSTANSIKAATADIGKTYSTNQLKDAFMPSARAKRVLRVNVYEWMCHRCLETGNDAIPDRMVRMFLRRRRKAAHKFVKFSALSFAGIYAAAMFGTFLKHKRVRFLTAFAYALPCWIGISLFACYLHYDWVVGEFQLETRFSEPEFYQKAWKSICEEKPIRWRLGLAYGIRDSEFADDKSSSK